MTTPRWNRQVNDVLITVPMPKSTKMYFKACKKINQHNRTRSDCGIDRSFCTNNWAIRVNFGILSMMFTDAYLLYRATHNNECEYNSKKFFAILADNMIDLQVAGDEQGKSTRSSKKRKAEATMLQKIDQFKRKTTHKRSGTNHAKQGTCHHCKKCTTHICIRCTLMAQGKQFWMCSGRDSITCWYRHMTTYHQEFK